MKRHLASILIYSVCTLAAVAQQSDKREITTQADLIRVHTAMEHITVIEFGEPVTMAAAGSTAFRIERQEDKVLIEPLKPGAATNLLIWTASRRFTYELEPAGEVTKMSVAIDNSIPKPKPAVTTELQMQQVADMVLTKAFLGAEPIQSKGIKTPSDGVLVRVQQIFRARNTVYIHYSIENHSQYRYHTPAPNVYELLAGHPSVALISFARTQLNRGALAKLEQTTQHPVAVAFADNDGADIAPGLCRQGVVAIRQDAPSLRILQLEFGPDVQATLVF
jgi:Conjugal transfer protein